MKDNSKLNFGDVKAYNQMQVLRHIYISGKKGMSQSSIARLTSLSAPSAFRIFTTLEESGLIKPLANTATFTSKGRQPVDYCINEDYLYKYGVEITRTSVTFALFNFAKDCLDTQVHFTEGKNADELLTIIIQAVNEMNRTHNINKDKFFGVGVALHGIIDIKSGVVLSSDKIVGMQDYPLKEKLTNALNCHISIRNIAESYSYHQFKYNSNLKDKSIFTLLLNNQIDGSFIQNNRIYTDSKGYSVDIGHLLIDPKGPVCTCGETGCLEALVFNIEGEYNPNILLNLGKQITTDLSKLDIITDKIVDYITVVYRNVNRLFNPECLLISTNNIDISRIIKNKLTVQMKKFGSKYSNDTEKPILANEYDVHSCLRGVSELLLAENFNN